MKLLSRVANEFNAATALDGRTGSLNKVLLPTPAILGASAEHDGGASDAP